MAKRYSFLIPAFIFSLFFLPAVIYAQSFEQGLRNYEQGDYQQAASVFAGLNSPQARLFAAKSYYGLGHFEKAAEILNDLLQNAAPGFYYEAAYTSSLIDFQQKQYANALMKLHTVFTNSTIESLIERANEFYIQILNYLTTEQRIQALKNINAAEIKYNLVETALGKISFSSFNKLINQFYESVDENKWRKKVRSIEETLSNEPAYKIEYGDDFNSFTPPDGTVYNIGIALPKFNTEEQTYSVVQGLYLGARLAAEQFNDQNPDTKVYFTFLPTGSGDIDNIVKSFAQKDNGDAIIGPLFSEQAEQMVSLSAEYKIPIIAPLATSNLKSNGSLFYQANSSFAAHGKAMAQFATNELEFDTFAIIAGKNTNGAQSAKAFREAVEASGGKVVSFQIPNFKDSEYDISSYVKKIGSSLTSVDAIYAPFTSNYTSYLVEQLIYSANTFENPVTLLGSPRWSDVDFSTDIYARSELFYSVNSFRSGGLNDFQYRYRQAFGISPNKFAVIGYDVSRYLLQLIDRIGNPALLNEAIAQSPLYSGLIKNIYFNGTHVNQAVQILKVGSGGQAILQQRQ